MPAGGVGHQAGAGDRVVGVLTVAEWYQLAVNIGFFFPESSNQRSIGPILTKFLLCSNLFPTFTKYTSKGGRLNRPLLLLALSDLGLHNLRLNFRAGHYFS